MNTLRALADQRLIDYCNSQRIKVEFQEFKYPLAATFLAKNGIKRICLARLIEGNYTKYRSALAICLSYHFKNVNRLYPANSLPQVYSLNFEGFEQDTFRAPDQELKGLLFQAARFFSEPTALHYPAELAEYIGSNDFISLAAELNVTPSIAQAVLEHLQSNPRRKSTNDLAFV